MALTKQISSRVIILSPTTAEVSTAQTIAPYYDFRIDGLLDIPVAETFDAARYIDAKQTLVAAKLSVLKGGTSQYRVVVTSYDFTGLNPVEHINTLVSPTDSNTIYTLPFIIPEVPANSTLVLSVAEEVVGSPASDLALTLVSGTFADLSQIVDALTSVHPVGTVMRASLNLSQFQSQMGSGWVEADGQSCTGTAYETITGNSTVPTITDSDGLLVMIRVN